MAQLADISIDDMLRWEAGGLRLLVPKGTERQILDRPVSWAVTIRAAQPVIPVLRGEEIVIVPGRLLAELEDAEMVGWADLVRLLATQPIAGIVVDDPDLTANGGVPIMIGSPSFLADAESRLNRELTERRAHLYRFGSDLARALSSTSMSGAGTDALLSAASRVADRHLVLLSGDGRILARSEAAPVDGWGESGLESPDRLARVSADGREWLVRQIEKRSLPPGSILAVELLNGESTEMARLVLTQTAEALVVLLDRSTNRDVDPVRERERLVADILLGRRWSFDSLDTQGMLRALQPANGLRVALFVSSDESVLERVRSAVNRDRRWPAAPLGTTEYGAILAEPIDETVWRELRGYCRHGSSLTIAVTEPVQSIEGLVPALVEARRLVQLVDAGLVAGPVVNGSDLHQLGVYGVLYPLWEVNGSSGRSDNRRLQSFADMMLSGLERNDNQRNGELIPSLAAYLQAGGSLAGASARLGVHRNTLSYRLARINELIDGDLADADTRFLFQLALAIRRMTTVLDAQQSG